MFMTEKKKERGRKKKQNIEHQRFCFKMKMRSVHLKPLKEKVFSGFNLNLKQLSNQFFFI